MDDVDTKVEEERSETGDEIERHKDIKGGGEMEGMIMSGNICLSIRIWTPINNILSQSTA